MKEPSSWAAIGGAFIALGLNVPEELWQHLANICAGAAFVVAVVRKEGE